jgi:hypothetical protein
MDQASREGGKLDLEAQQLAELDKILVDLHFGLGTVQPTRSEIKKQEREHPRRWDGEMPGEKAA